MIFRKSMLGIFLAASVYLGGCADHGNLGLARLVEIKQCVLLYRLDDGEVVETEPSSFRSANLGKAEFLGLSNGDRLLFVDDVILKAKVIPKTSSTAEDGCGNAVGRERREIPR